MNRLFYKGVEVHSHREYMHRGIMMSDINFSVPRTDLTETKCEVSKECGCDLLRQQLTTLSLALEAANEKIAALEKANKEEQPQQKENEYVSLSGRVFKTSKDEVTTQGDLTFNSAQVTAEKDGKTIILGVLDSEEYKAKLSELKLQDKFVKSVLDGRTKQHKGYSFKLGQ